MRGFTITTTVRHRKLRRGLEILKAAAAAADSFVATFAQVRQARHARGTPTDEEQDLLRAMLLFAAAGLDSMMKEVVRTGLADVLDRDKGAHEQLIDFVQRRIRQPDSGSEFAVKFIATAMSSASPRRTLVAELIRSLTDSSLQSAEQVLKVAAQFGVASSNVCDDISRLKVVFIIRNQIAHEMDVDFTARNRSRRSRSKRVMTKATQFLFDIGGAFLLEVEKKLEQKTLR